MHFHEPTINSSLLNLSKSMMHGIMHSLILLCTTYVQSTLSWKFGHFDNQNNCQSQLRNPYLQIVNCKMLVCLFPTIVLMIFILLSFTIAAPSHLQPNLDLYRYSFLPRTILQWNDLQITNIETLNLSNFKEQLQAAC